MRKGLLLCCHGTKNNKGIKDTIKLLRIFKQRNKNSIVKIGYLEIAKPTIENQLDFFFKKKFDNLLIVPAMIFSGNHVTKDIPKILNNLKKNYKTSPNIFINPPLLKSKKFLNVVQSNIIKSLRMINRKKDGLIVVASNTINSMAKVEINYLARKIAKKNNINFYKEILITLNKKNLKKNLKKLNSKYNNFLVLPLFLFRGNLLENLSSVIRETNKKEKKNFFLCSHLSDYKKIYNVIDNLIKS